MVKCRNCAFYNGTTCTEPLGINYNKNIPNPDDEITCDAYLDIASMYLIEDLVS